VKGFVTNNSKPLIAIVDDDESVCRAIKRLVRSLGMEADMFTSGQEFVELMETPFAKVDCVVLDVQMPGLNDELLIGTLRAALERDLSKP
jgi:FixJ family two-component response regulator